MINRDQLQERVSALTDAAGQVLALRAAMRVFPLLAATPVQAGSGSSADSAFGFWRQDVRAAHLLALFSAQSALVLTVLDDGLQVHQGQEILTDITRVVADTAEAAILAAPVTTDVGASTASFVAVAAHTVNAVWFACLAATNKRAVIETVNAAMSAVNAYDYASRIADNGAGGMLTAELERDLDLLQNASPAQLGQFELWAGDNRAQWQSLLEGLRVDAMRLDASFQVWADWYDDRVSGKPVDLELLRRWQGIPIEIRAQGVASVNAFLKNLAGQEMLRPLNRVRAIFLGYGDAGKTSLIRALHGEPVVEGLEPMTPGIAIRDWSVPDTDIKASFWDFGGQVMAHATHQFFLRSSCVYVLVISARAEINATEQAEYWLQHVRAFGNDAPVLIVGNKFDQTPVHLDMALLCEKYPNIVGFFPLSCARAHSEFSPHFTAFFDALVAQLQIVGAHQMMFSESQFRVMNDLRNRAGKTAFIARSDFELLCDVNGVGIDGVQNRSWLLDILDKLGIVMHFPTLPFLDEYVLNPRWLTYGIYAVMYMQRARLSASEIVQALAREMVTDENGQLLDYPEAKVHLVIEVMRLFKLCYFLPGSRDTILIPALLPSYSPKIDFDKAHALVFAFVFDGFVPRHIVPELIVERNVEIDAELVWQYGVVLRPPALAARALVVVDYHMRRITITVTGDDSRGYLQMLRDDLLRILARLSLDFEERLILPKTARIDGELFREREEWANYHQIVAFEKNRLSSYISASGAKYDVLQVLNSIRPAQKEIGNVVFEDRSSNQFNHESAPSASDAAVSAASIIGTSST